MVIALDPNATIRFIASCDRELPEDEQTVWLIRPLKPSERAALQDDYAQASLTSKNGKQEQHIAMRINSMMLAAVHLGLMGWENFQDGEGKDMRLIAKGEGVRRKISEGSLAMIPEDVITEISDAVQTAASLSRAEAGN